MKQTEYRWKSYDGLELFGRTWTTETKPKAVIILVHNHGEHSGIHEDSARNLTGKNYYVVSMDLRGHGRSEGKRGYASSYRKLVKDLETLIDNSESLFPGFPKILIGQGLGGNIAIYYLSTHITNISCLIAISPWLVLEHRFPKSRMFIGNIIRHVLPTCMLETGFIRAKNTCDIMTKNFLDKTIDTIIEGAKTGKIGDGKIFVLDLPECIRIRTGEKGNKAIG